MTLHRLLGFASLAAIVTALACAARTARPAHAAATSTAASPAQPADGQDARAANAGPASRRRHREATWDEYYSEIAERARKRGILVMWFNPPSVHCVADVQLER